MQGTIINSREQFVDEATPASMRSRPVDHRGFPVPWFVTNKTSEGHWDFVKIERERFAEALRFEKCWVSGQRLGKFRAFCVGPMCVINRTAGDPPVTRDIALWSVKICPFMSRPLARRDGHKEGLVETSNVFDGVGVMRNPGVTAVWVTKNSEYQRGSGFYLGDPHEVTWWREGRTATRAEVDASIASGIHHLEKLAREEGPEAEAELRLYKQRAEPILPRSS
jgi:hypothetical protein